MTIENLQETFHYLEQSRNLTVPNCTEHSSGVTLKFCKGTERKRKELTIWRSLSPFDQSIYCPVKLSTISYSGVITSFLKIVNSFLLKLLQSSSISNSECPNTVTVQQLPSYLKNWTVKTSFLKIYEVQYSWLRGSVTRAVNCIGNQMVKFYSKPQ